ncbi:MAG: nucleoid-associated protein YgaU [Methylophagaceae bacterium]
MLTRIEDNNLVIHEDILMIRYFYLSVLFVLFSVPLFAKDVMLNATHPQNYEVVRGDTLWDISAKFLQHPWQWPEIWQVNPQINNPHLIYPGDLLSLSYINGQPVLTLTRGSRAYKLSPEVREIKLEEAISTIPRSAISAFLSKPLVVGEETLSNAPYIVASTDERLILGAGDRAYVRGIEGDEIEQFSVFRGGKVYTDPETAEVLGYEAIYTADAMLETASDISTVMLRNTNREVLTGDRLLPVDDGQNEMNFFPHSPEQAVNGRIISVFDGVSQVGQYQIVVLNRGTRESIEVGHVLAVMRAGQTVRDTVTSDKDDMITLPDESAGVAMVFKVFEKVSYALVMTASHAIHLNDKVSEIE